MEFLQDFATTTSFWLFPLSMLFGSAIYGITLDWLYRDTFFSKAKQTFAKPKESVAISRRSFIEKGVSQWARSRYWLLESMVSSRHNQLVVSLPEGTPINITNAPSIFENPRLAKLVNSEVTSNDRFYQVDIDFLAPSVDASTWSLQVTGLVQNPKTYSLSQLQGLPKAIEYNTFECVSNDVNGNLISNGEWGGVKLSDLFADMGGVSAGAEYVVFYSTDGYSVGIPLTKALESDSILAYEMNSVPLPQNHGYPLRAVIPGLYRMMSAKWIRKISVVDTTYMGYWQTRGWSNVGTVQTLAFITTPGDGVRKAFRLTMVQ